MVVIKLEDLEDKEIIRLYSELMNDSLLTKIIGMLIRIEIGLGIIVLILFPQLKIIFIILFFSSLAYYYIGSTPKYYSNLLNDERLFKLYYDPFLRMRCQIASRKISKEERRKYPWLIYLNRFSWIFPILTFVLIILGLFNGVINISNAS